MKKHDWMVVLVTVAICLTLFSSCMASSQSQVVPTDTFAPTMTSNPTVTPNPTSTIPPTTTPAPTTTPTVYITFDAEAFPGIDDMHSYHQETKIILKGTREDGTVVDAQVRGGDSSPCGPHEAGLTVRLALMLAMPYSWQHHKALISWCGVDGADVDLHITF